MCKQKITLTFSGLNKCLYKPRNKIINYFRLFQEKPHLAEIFRPSVERRAEIV